MAHGLPGGLSFWRCHGRTAKMMWVWVNTYRYIFSGMNIHLPAILGFTRYQGFDPSPCVGTKLCDIVGLQFIIVGLMTVGFILWSSRIFPQKHFRTNGRTVFFHGLTVNRASLLSELDVQLSGDSELQNVRSKTIINRPPMTGND